MFNGMSAMPLATQELQNPVCTRPNKKFATSYEKRLNVSTNLPVISLLDNEKDTRVEEFKLH